VAKYLTIQSLLFKITQMKRLFEKYKDYITVDLIMYVVMIVIIIVSVIVISLIR